MVARLEPRPPGLIRSPLFGNDGAPAGKLGDGGIDKQHDPRSDERHEPAYRVVPLVDNRSDAKRAGPLPVSRFIAVTGKNCGFPRSLKIVVATTFPASNLEVWTVLWTPPGK